MQKSNNEEQMTPSDQEQYDIKEPTEPLMSITDVLGWQAPEKFPDKTEEEQQLETALYESRSPYEVWQGDKSKKNLYNVVKSLQPTINSVLASIGGNSPNIRSKARVLTAKYIQSYDPSTGTSLPTWISSNLRQLTRDIRKSNQDIQIPEGIQLDAFSIHKAEVELADELGRDPTVEEVSNRAHLSIKRIKDVKAKNKKQGSEQSGTLEDGSNVLTQTETDFTNEAVDYVYADSDLKDKKLLEYVMGYGGAEPLDSKTIMQKLKLTPVQLTRRKMRLSKRIMDVKNDLDNV